MIVELEPKSARAYIPFVVDIESVAEKPTLEVRKENEPNGFLLPGVVKKGEDAYRVQFALEHPGDYTLAVKAGEEYETMSFVVEPQIFMGFTKQFGIFTLLFLIVMTGVVFWIRRIQKREAEKSTA